MAKAARAKGAAKAAIAAKKTPRDKSGRASPVFDFRAGSLPEAIAAAAFGSGGFPYDRKLKNKAYCRDLRILQIELVKAANWIRERGERVVLIFEGRDGAGKGGAIARLTQHLNPRQARIVALSKPTEAEQGQWYFQRYARRLPGRGEIVILDRSWYNRAAVEPVFGFCAPEQTSAFLNEAPEFERMLARDGVRIVKMFLTIGREMQARRLHKRWRDPLGRWKISAIDAAALEKWDAYSEAFERMFAATDITAAPWAIIRANDKRRARLEVIRHVLRQLPYAPAEEKKGGEPDPKIVLSASGFLADGGEK